MLCSKNRFEEAYQEISVDILKMWVIIFDMEDVPWTLEGRDAAYALQIVVLSRLAWPIGSEDVATDVDRRRESELHRVFEMSCLRLEFVTAHWGGQ